MNITALVFSDQIMIRYGDASDKCEGYTVRAESKVSFVI